jgi:hypothetical protein
LQTKPTEILENKYKFYMEDSDLFIIVLVWEREGFSIAVFYPIVPVAIFFANTSAGAAPHCS